MKKTRRSLMAALLAVLMTFTAAKAFAAEPAEGSREIYDSTGAYFSDLIDGTPLQVGSTGGEWIVIGLMRSGKMTETQIEAYYQTAAEFVEQNANANEQLHRAKSTENSRLILALTAIGKDVTDVNGHNLLKGLSDQKYLEKQGINGPIWALIALDSRGYEIPVTHEGGTQASRDSIIESILGAQQEGGWWSLTGIGADPDVTGMTIQALAPYYDSNDDVKTAVDAAVAALSESQAEDGSFASTGFFGGTSNVESVAQVVVALTALGIDPHTDTRFVKNGHSVVDALCSFAVEGGGFRHVAGGNRDGMASEQGYYALTAYFRYLDGKTSLYDMSDLDEKTDPGDSEDPGTTSEDSEASETTSEDGEASETTSEDSEATETTSEDSKATETTSEDSEASETTSDDSEATETTSEDSEASETTSEDGEASETTSEDSEASETTSEDSETTETTSEDGETTETTSEDSEASETTSDDGKNLVTDTSDGGGADGTQSEQPATSPQTGDDFHVVPYLCLISLSLVVIIAMTALRVKENRR